MKLWKRCIAWERGRGEWRESPAPSHSNQPVSLKICTSIVSSVHVLGDGFTFVFRAQPSLSLKGQDGWGEVALITGERVPLSTRQWACLCRKPLACLWLSAYVNLGLFINWRMLSLLVCVLWDPRTWSYTFTSYWLALLSILCSVKIVKELIPFTVDDCDSLSFFLLPPFPWLLLFNSDARSPLRRSKLSRSQILGPSMPGEDLFRAETMSQKFQTHVNDQKVSWLGAICCKAESWPIFASGGSCTEPPRKGIHSSLSLQLDLQGFLCPGSQQSQVNGTLRKHRFS